MRFERLKLTKYVETLRRVVINENVKKDVVNGIT